MITKSFPVAYPLPRSPFDAHPFRWITLLSRYTETRRLIFFSDFLFFGFVVFSRRRRSPWIIKHQPNVRRVFGNRTLVVIKCFYGVFTSSSLFFGRSHPNLSPAEAIYLFLWVLRGRKNKARWENINRWLSPFHGKFLSVTLFLAFKVCRPAFLGKTRATSSMKRRK